MNELGADAAQIAPGAQITFSSGAAPDAIDKMLVSTEANARMQGIAMAFPHLAGALTKRLSLYTNFYPSGFGVPQGAVAVETGMRVTTALKAVTLARAKQMNFLLSAQPVGAALVANELSRLKSAPKGPFALIALGGYESFAPLEAYVREAFEACFEQVEILHLYGVNEVGFALMAGQRKRDLIYRPIQTDWRISFDDGAPRFVHTQTGETVPCEDQITPEKEGYLIKQPTTKIAVKVRDFLSRQHPSWWLRHTGFMGVQEGKMVWQLRPRLGPIHADEMRFGAFLDQFDMSYSEKPNWVL